MRTPALLLLASIAALAAVPVTALAVDEATRRLASSSDWEKRWDACESLCKEGSRDAAVVLLRLIGDEDPQVRDHAIWACKGFTSDEAAGALAAAASKGNAADRRSLAAGLERTKNLVVLDALGRLARSDPDAGVRAEAIESIRGLPDDPRKLAIAAEAAKDAVPLVRACAVWSASGIPKAGGRDVILAAFRDADAGVRAAALAAMWSNDAQASLPAAAADPSWRVRAQAADTALGFRTAVCVDVLVRLVGDPSDRVAAASARALRRLSGKDFGRDPSIWASWWAQNRAGWAPPKTVARDPRVAPKDGTHAQFMGIELEGACTAFVVDASGSMDAPADGARSRAEVVRAEIAATLAALPDGHRVNVILFDDRVRTFEDRAKALTPKVREAIAAFLRRESPGGQTNLYGGIAAALADDAVDGVYVLSDGAPTVGEATSRNRVRELVLRANRTRKVIVHCVAIGIAEEDEEDRGLLEDLAAGSGGRCLFR